MYQLLVSFLILSVSCLTISLIEPAEYDGPPILSCLVNLRTISEKVQVLDVADDKFIAELNGYCELYLNCTQLFNKISDSAIEKPVAVLTNFCDSVKFRNGDFKDCLHKLDDKNSTCYQNWDPFPDTRDIEDEEEKYRVEQTACKNFFGEDSCLMDEIIESCGKEKWEGFKKHHLSMNAIYQQCDFDEK